LEKPFILIGEWAELLLDNLRALLVYYKFLGKRILVLEASGLILA
jgi:hypothetical protein